MNKEEVQQRVLQDGKPLALRKFSWDKKTRTFLSFENDLILDFSDISNCIFKTGSDCTFKTGSNCIFKTWSDCTFETGDNCIFKTDWDCTFKTGDNCTFNTGWDCTFKTGSGCIFNTGWGCALKTGSNCTFKTGNHCAFNTGWNCTFKTCWNCTFKTCWNCTFKTGNSCTFDTGDNCTFKTGNSCTFDTGSNCIFKTGSHCTFKTSNNCTFDTDWSCIFKTGSDCAFKTSNNCTFKTDNCCVIIRRDIFEIIQSKKGDVIQTCPYSIKGYLKNGLYNNEPHIIADGILSKIVNKKGSLYTVINHGETKKSYLIKDKDTYAHGKTIKEAREALQYKFKNKDLSEYKNTTPETVVTHKEALQMYHDIAGACSSGIKYFIEQNPDKIKEKYTVSEIIKLTEGQFGHAVFKQFFKNKRN